MVLEKNETTHASLIEDVWQRFHNGDSSCRNTLVEEYLPLVHFIAERVYKELFGKVALEDLISTGTFGLMDAITSFDSGRGVKFGTYCRPRIRGSMIDEVRSMDWIPRLTRSRHRKLTETRQILEATMGREPTDEEISMELHMPLDQVKLMRDDSNVIDQLSLEHPISDGGKAVYRLGDTLPSHCEDAPDRQALRQDLKDLIQQGLSRAERLVMQLYYGEGMLMREIGATLDLSESRVCQMHSEIVVRLRVKFARHGLLPPKAA